MLSTCTDTIERQSRKQGAFRLSTHNYYDDDAASAHPVKERYAFSDGDYHRVRNQQLYMKAVMSDFLCRETLTEPAKISRVVSEISPYLSVEEQFDAGAVAGLVLILRTIRSTDVEFFTMPNLGIGTPADGQLILVKDEAAIAEIAGVLDSGSLGITAKLPILRQPELRGIR